MERSIFRYIITVNIVLILSTQSALGQCSLVYKQTFGTAAAPSDTTLMTPPHSVAKNFNPTYSYYNANPFCNSPQGSYSIRYISSKCDTTWVRDIDHTFGDVNGYMLLVNPAKQHDPIYIDTIYGTCADYQYNFIVYVANPSATSKKCNGPKPNITLKAIDPVTGSIISSYSSNPIVGSGTDTLNWMQVTMQFRIPSGKNSFIFEIDNDGASSVCGNQFFIDDIELQVCKPTLSISANNQTQDTVQVCQGGQVNFSSTMLPDTLASPVYQWQTSTDKLTWTNMPGATDKILTLNHAAVSDNKYYRLIVVNSLYASEPGCGIISNIIYLKVWPLPSITASNNGPLCAGQDLQLNATGSGLTYQWTGPDEFMSTLSNPQIVNALINNSGKYYVTGSDVHGCSNRDSTNVAVNLVPKVNLGNDTLLCQGMSVVLRATNPGATYMWSTYTTADTLFVSASSLYAVAVTIGNCVARDTIQVGFVPVPVVNLGNDTSICQGSNLTLDAKNPGATYLWSNGTTTQTISVNATGQYWVKVMQGICAYSDTINVTVNQLPMVDFSDSTVLCSGATLTLQANNPGATYLWSDNSTSDTLKVTTGGLYWVNVTKNGCTTRDSILVKSTGAIRVNLGNDTILCQGAALLLDAQNSGYHYRWQDGNTTQIYPVSGAGQYSVTVSSGTCMASDTINVMYINKPVVNLGNDTSLCTGSSLTIDAGNSGNTYLWNTGSTTPTITVFNTDNYSVSVSNGVCMARDTIAVQFLSRPVVYLGNDTTLCVGNSLILDAKNPGYTYLWSNGFTTKTIMVNMPDNYWVQVANGNCKVSDTMQLRYDTIPPLDLGRDSVLCEGTPLTLDTKISGAQYLWNNNTTAATLPATTSELYWVRVTKGVCVESDSIKVSFDKKPIVNLGNDTSLCIGSTLTLDAGNTGAAYLWNTGATGQRLLVNATNLYWVKVTMGACATTDSIDMHFNAKPILDLGNDTAMCTGNTLRLDAQNPGYLHFWNTGDTTRSITVSNSGKYLVRVDNFGCKVSDSVNVVFYTQPVVKLGRNTTLCTGSQLVLDADNNSNSSTRKYSWNTGDTTQKITVTQAGIYSVKVENNICQAQDTIIINYNTPPYVELGNDTALCAGNSLVLDAKNPKLFRLWNTGDTTRTITIKNNGTYSVLVDSSGCRSIDFIKVTFYDQPVVDLGNDTSMCQGTPLLLNGGNDTISKVVYNWNTGDTTQTISVTQSGVYSVKVTNNICSDQDTISVKFDRRPNVDLGKDTALCEGEFLTLNAYNSNYPKWWNTGDTTSIITVNTTGVYSIQVTNGVCKIGDTINVSFDKIPVLSSLPTDTTLCTGKSINISVIATNARQYFWNNGGTTPSIVVSSAGQYSVKVVNGACSSTATVMVRDHFPKWVKLNPVGSICPGDSLIFNASAPYMNYKWSTGSTQPTITVYDPGIYILETTDLICKIKRRDTVIVFPKPLPKINLGRDTVICNGEKYTILPRASHYDQLIWGNGSFSNAITVTQPGNYQVTAINTCGTAVDDINIDYVDCSDDFIVPNAFTPNKDGHNDLFRPKVLKSAMEYELRVFNRWGELVFITHDMHEGWDGTYRGRNCIMDTYVWYIFYRKESNMQKLFKKGFLVLIR